MTGSAIGCFRGHVREGSEHVTRVGQVFTVGQAGHPEVHEFGATAPVRDDQVRRLDVPVDHLAVVGVVECLADVDPDLGDLAIAEQVVVNQFADRLAVDQFRDEVGPSAFPPELVMGELEEGDDAGVVQPGRRLRFPLDARTRFRPGFDHLDGDFPFEATVPCPVDRAEAAGAQAFVDLEAVEDRSFRPSLSTFRHRCPRTSRFNPYRWWALFG